jgi:hypothetical protein
MAVHRKRRRRKASGPPRLPRGTYAATLAPGDDLGAAADVIADEARRLAGQWSTSIPDDIHVEVRDRTATIWTDAGPAYPNEVEGVKHPTFGHKPWVTNQHRPFLGPAADAKASDAMERFAERYDRILRKAGFK